MEGGGSRLGVGESDRQGEGEWEKRVNEWETAKMGERENKSEGKNGRVMGERENSTVGE